MKTLLTGLALFAATFSATYSARAAQIGDAAAPLEIAEWVKGDAVDLAAVKGKKVVVVEFWATWCGPCRVSIPHLTELQKKYGDRGVVVVGVSDEVSAKVKPFVDEQGAKMNYTVAIDRNNATSDGYMKRYAQNGIPHAFVVDKDGRIAWHGHPMSGLDRVLDQLAANTFDMGSERKRENGVQKLEEYFQKTLQGATDAALEKLGAELTALDREMGGIDPAGKLDLAELRRSARFQNAMADYQRALTAGRNDSELAALQAKAAPFAPRDFKFEDFKGGVQLQRLFSDYYRAVTGRGDESRAGELARKLESASSDNAEMLNDMAWTLLTDEKIKNRNLKLATKFAQAAVDASGGKDANVLDTHARALFDSGKVDEAVRQEKKAIEFCDSTEKKAEFQVTLKRYQEKTPVK